MSRAKKLETTSDVTRFRGVVIAALLATAATMIASVAFTGKDQMRGVPGPLSRSHQRAKLECAQCHVDSKDAATACSGCHGKHPSSRGPHQELAQAGQLLCTDCHQGHGESGGVLLFADGRGMRFGNGSESVLPTVAGYRGIVETTVPVINVGACGACHDYESPRDPLAVCLVAELAALGPGQPTLCFDEHVAPGGARDAAWEAARHVVVNTPPPPALRRGTRLGPWSWLGLGGLVGLVVLGASRARPQRNPRDSETPAQLQAPEVLRLPVINGGTCLGCHACVDACPFDVLEIRRYVAVVARPAACCGLTLCEQRCPNGSLVMGDGEHIEDAVALDDTLQSRIAPGIYMAGDVTGLPLIRNAINQGAHALRALAEDLGRDKGKGDLDVVIVGAGPAGISAALEAKSLGLRYLVLEQATVAGSIQSFPRAKLVFDQPLELPLVGQLWLEESSKEELLARWLRIVRSEKLAIREGVRVAGVHVTSGGMFSVDSVDADGNEDKIQTQRVLLAIGKRGSPRTLPLDVPESMAGRVFYSLADARTFAGQRVIVVGLGDVAMEAAIALSRQPGTQVIITHRGADFSRGKARNIEELRRRVAAGAIDLRLDTTVNHIAEGRATLLSGQDEEERQCDGLFVLIGTIPPIEFLTRVGVLPSPTHNESKEDIES